MFEIISKLLENLVSKPMTVKFPHESIPISKNYRGKHKFNIDKCVSCGQCSRICPNQAIEMVEAPEKSKQEYKKTYPKIDLGKCCYCELCEEICPTDALHLSKNLPSATFDRNTTFIEPFDEKTD